MLRRILQSSLFKTASIYGLANMLRQAVPVLLVPVLTRYLTPADYGTTAVFNVLVTVFVAFVGVNVHGAIGRKYFDRDQLDLPAYVFNCVLIIAVSTILTAGAVWLGAGPISAVSEVPRSWLWAAVVVASAQILINSLLSLLQVQGKAVAYAVIQVGRSAAIAGGATLFVVGLHMDWRGSVLGQLCAAVLFSLISLALLARGGWLRPRVQPDYIRSALSFGLPLVPHALSGVVVAAVDRLFVAHYAGIAQTGLYSLGYQLGAVIGLLEDSFNRAFQPWLFEQLKRDDPETKRKIVLFTYGYFVVFFALAVGLGAAAPLILSILVPERFQGAYVHVIWIALGYAFNGMYKMVSGYMFFAERTGALAWLTFASACINVLLNYLLVPRYGAIGSAYATSAGFFASFVLTWIVSARVYPMPWALGVRPRQT
jgi:O-antigen/teichoic acid export membrane protein